jgi:hypothetical protein
MEQTRDHKEHTPPALSTHTYRKPLGVARHNVLQYKVVLEPVTHPLQLHPCTIAHTPTPLTCHTRVEAHQPLLTRQSYHHQPPSQTPLD